MRTFPVAYDFPIPARTPERSAISSTFFITLPWIIGGEVYFPAGCKGQVGIRLLDAGEAIAPSIGWYFGDGVSVPISITRGLKAGNRITIQGYNVAADYAHTPKVRLILANAPG